MGGLTGLCLTKVLDAGDLSTRQLNRMLKELSKRVEMLAQLLGKTDIRNLEPEDLRALTLNASSITGTSWWTEVEGLLTSLSALQAVAPLLTHQEVYSTRNNKSKKHRFY